MMKIGCNYLSLPDLDVESFIRTAYDLRLDVIDFHRRAFTTNDPAYLLGIKRLCLELGLPIGYIGVSNSFVGDDAQLQAEIEKCNESIDLAALLGAPLIRVFGAYVAPESEDSERVFADMCRCNREIARYGAEKGVIVALQNHDHGNLVATAPDVIRTLDETDHPNFAFLLDTGQWRGSAGANPEHISDPTVDIYGYIEQTLPRAVYVRTKFYRVESGEETVLDYGRIAAILRAGGYNGPLSIVYEGDEEDRVNAVAKAAAHLRRVFGDVSVVG